MFDTILPMLAAAAAAGGAACWISDRKWGRRMREMEGDLRTIADVLLRMSENQAGAYRDLSGNLGVLEERLVDLALPGGDPQRPLERRHRVLSLANKGVALDDISQKLNIPRGEAELIVNLRRYADSVANLSIDRSDEAKGHA